MLNDEFDGEEYVMTNKFEAYRVMSTIVIVCLNYIEQHPNVNTFEFVGEPKADKHAEFPKKRLTLYQRYLPKIFDKTWKKSVKGNRVIISKK